MPPFDSLASSVGHFLPFSLLRDHLQDGKGGMDYSGGPWMAVEKPKLKPAYPLVNLPWVQMNGRADEGEDTVTIPATPPAPCPLLTSHCLTDASALANLPSPSTPT